MRIMKMIRNKKRKLKKEDTLMIFLTDTAFAIELIALCRAPGLLTHLETIHAKFIDPPPRQERPHPWGWLLV